MVPHPVSWLFGFGVVSMLLVLAGVALLVVWAVLPHSVSPTLSLPAQATPRDTPLEILARRFAAGEIAAEDYQRGRDLLGGGKA